MKSDWISKAEKFKKAMADRKLTATPQVQAKNKAVRTKVPTNDMDAYKKDLEKKRKALEQK